jgi:hypothetical protein
MTICVCPVLKAVANKTEAANLAHHVLRSFSRPKPSSSTVTLGSTQPLTEMSTRYLGVKGGQCVRLTTSPPSVSRLSRENVGASMSHNPIGLHGLIQG